MQQAIRVIIIEDDPLSADQLRDWILKIEKFQLINICSTGSQALESIQKDKPEVIFSDIELPDMNAFEIFEALPADERPFIVFTTAHNDHAIKAFEISAVDYLLKPFDEKRFRSTVSKIINLYASQSKEWAPSVRDLLSSLKQEIFSTNLVERSIPVKISGKIHFVDIDTIEFVQASSYYIEIFSENKKYLLRESLSEFLTRLPESQFIRIHRSVIINLNFVKQIEKVNQNDYQVRLKNDQTHRISKTYRKKFFEVCNLEG